MTLPTSVIINWVFIPIYAILFLGTLFCGVKNGFGRAAGFFSLVLFAGVRLAANGILTWCYYNNYQDTKMFTTGEILQGVGFSFLVTSTISFLTNVAARNSGWTGSPSDKDDDAKPKQPQALRILHLVNLGALVLLIMGYTSSPDAFNGQNQGLNVKAKIGDGLFLIITVLCALFTLYLFPKSTGSSRSIVLRVLCALPFMAVRAGYGLWHTFQVPFLGTSIWIKLIIEYAPEVIIVAVYITIGFVKREPAYSNSLDTLAERQSFHPAQQKINSFDGKYANSDNNRTSQQANFDARYLQQQSSYNYA